jgi:shikimate dehydrogenase
VLGTGGAAKAIWYALDVLGIPYKKVSRQKEGADFQYEEITGDLLGEYHLVINTTPLGMYPNTGESPAIPYKGSYTRAFFV